MNKLIVSITFFYFLVLGDEVGYRSRRIFIYIFPAERYPTSSPKKHTGNKVNNKNNDGFKYFYFSYKK